MLRSGSRYFNSAYTRRDIPVSYGQLMQPRLLAHGLGFRTASCGGIASFSPTVMALPRCCELKSREDWDKVLQSTDTFLFDCDGVIWTGNNEPVSGAKDVLKFLRSKGKSLCFVSNNSSKSREEYLRKFKELDIEAYEDEVFPTSYVTAYYLRHILQVQRKVYLLGSPGFERELELQDIRHIGTGPLPIEGSLSDWMGIKMEPDVSAVVVGFDIYFNYMKLIRACTYLKNPSCHFIATNEDPTLPSRSENVIPGTGCMVSCVKCGAQREPTVVGKPHQPMFDVIQHSKDLDPSRTLMIGDRVTTDIKFGNTFGMKTLVVFTGIAQRGDLPSLPPEQAPDYYCNSVEDMLVCQP